MSHPAPLPAPLYQGSVNTWECDDGGHLNVRFHFERAMVGLAHFARALEMTRAFTPLRTFMLRQTREKDLALFININGGDRPSSVADVPADVVIPAFLISELKSAFQIGFMIFIPFLIIDMIVASVLMSLGMMMLSPVLVALPFKLMLFVLADGWNLLLGSLAASFVT